MRIPGHESARSDASVSARDTRPLCRPRSAVLVLLSFLCLYAGATAGNASLVSYDFEGEVVTPAETHARVSAGSLTYTGDDATPAFPAGHGGSTDCFSLANWPPNGTLPTYYAFSITVEEGFKIQLGTLRFSHSRSSTGPTNWVVRYSRNDTTFSTLRSGTLPGADTWYDTETHVTNLTGTVYFRLYASQSSAAIGTWRIDDVALTGTVEMDDGRRLLHFQSFEGDAVDNWAVTTNAGAGSVDISSVRYSSGRHSQRLTGSAAQNADPYVDLAIVDLTGVAEPRLWVAYAADNPDSDDDLYVQLSYDGGTTWSWTNKLVDGYGSRDVAFGETSATNPTTSASNPFHYLIPDGNSTVAVRLLFDERADTSNTSDHYYLDSLRLTGRRAPLADTAPRVANYGAAFRIQANQATVPLHVLGGYPYPSVTVYWGPTDGGQDSGAWSYAASLGTQVWGYTTTTIGGLEPGRTYYYRFHASNSEGNDWTDTAASFRTTSTGITATRRMYLDEFAVSSHMPLNIDDDGDGLSDAWEIAYLGGKGAVPDGNADGDEMTNEEEFWAGTDPSDANSYLRIRSVDISDSTSEDITITWSGGDHPGPTDFTATGDRQARVYTLLAADSDAANRKSPAVKRFPTGTGTNTWVDTNAVAQFSGRFYTVSVIHNNGAYTNTQEWGVFAQERPANGERLICVPVHYGVTASNNLNAVLGVQLARGMHAGNGPGDSDSIRILNGSGTWDVYYLSSAHGWTDTAFAGPVDVEITPGQPIWVARGNGAVARPNAVYAGLTFDNSMMAERTFGRGEWTAFGWPLPSARTHTSTGGTNQLGFSAKGTGGTSYDRSTVNSGDQIWVPAGNGWRYYMLADNHADGGETVDGRWWGNGTGGGGQANFSLEPGKAYYYFHTTNWTSTTFSWKPATP